MCETPTQVFCLSKSGSQSVDLFFSATIILARDEEVELHTVRAGNGVAFLKTAAGSFR